MAKELRFDGKVVIVTGAGNGLGRSHALLFGSRGAKVVVNDLGGSAFGGGKSSAAADKVVEEIKAAGGEAVANYDSVEDGTKIVQTALDTFGRLDVVINNAGILRDTTFHKMSQEDWDLIYKVHVLGSFRVTQAAWPVLRDQSYGRIIMTASAAGIYGNFGQANYSMAKLGLLGFANTLALEGKKRNVHVNTIAPIAGSRLTETVLPKEITDALKPEYVSPLVAWLCHDGCNETGGLFEVGGGFYSKLRWERTKGKTFKLGRPQTVEAIQNAWPQITSFDGAEHPADITSSMQPVMANIQAGPSKGGNDLIDCDQALGYEYPPMTTSYDERDLALYALGVGAAANPHDDKELRLVYELHSQGFTALPTFGVIPSLKVMMQMAKEGKQAPGMTWGFERLLHGEQYTELKRPLPPHAKLTIKNKIKDIFDKGKNAVIVTESRTYDESGEELVYNESTAVIRGAGGWGGDRGPAGELNVPPGRAADATVEEKIGDNQALLYRLSGDWNPLHADPSFASAFGFQKPILHGLCTYGYAARHVIKAFSDNDPRYFKSIKARFAESVYPGETLVTEMWKESDDKIVFRCKVKERDKVVISNAAVELYKEIPKKKEAPKAAAASATTPAPAQAASSEPTSRDVFTAIGKHIEKNAGLAAKLQTIFLFKLSAPESAWTIDLKNGAGKASEGVEKADVTLELSDADFMAMCTGKADPQKLYFSGKLKISGNVMASQKLMFLKEIDPEQAKKAVLASKQGGGAKEAPKAASSASAGSAAVAASVFQKLEERLAKNPGLAKEVDAVIQFEITNPDASWTASLQGEAKIARGKHASAAAVLTLADEDLAALASGKESAQSLYQHGKLRVDGDVRVAHRLGFLKGLA